MKKIQNIVDLILLRCLTLSDLWTQFSLCQIPTTFSVEMEEFNFQIYVESQGVPHNQNNPKKMKLKDSHIPISKLTTGIKAD